MNLRTGNMRALTMPWNLRKTLKRYLESTWVSGKQTWRVSRNAKGISRERFACNVW